MRNACIGLSAFALAAVLCGQDQNGAPLQQFRLKVEQVNGRLKASYKTAERLVRRREKLFETSDPDERLKLLDAYLEDRELSVRETRSALRLLDDAITQADTIEFFDNPTNEPVIATYFEDCEALFHDLDMIEAEARMIEPNGTDETNPYLAAVQEVRGSMANALELLQTTRRTAGEHGIKKQELITFLKALRVGLAARQALQLFDYKATAAVTRTQRVKREYQKLHDDAFEGLDPGAYLEDLAYAGDDVAAWTGILTHLLTATPAQQIDLDEDTLRQAVERIRARPKSIRGPEGRTYRYDRRNRCYYTLVPGKLRRHWAPFDVTTNTGQFVRFKADSGRWVSQHPAYGDKPRELSPDDVRQEQ